MTDALRQVNTIMGSRRLGGARHRRSDFPFDFGKYGFYSFEAGYAKQNHSDQYLFEERYQRHPSLSDVFIHDAAFLRSVVL